MTMLDFQSQQTYMLPLSFRIGSSRLSHLSVYSR